MMSADDMAVVDIEVGGSADETNDDDVDWVRGMCGARAVTGWRMCRKIYVERAALVPLVPPRAAGMLDRAPSGDCALDDFVDVVVVAVIEPRSARNGRWSNRPMLGQSRRQAEL